MRPRALVDIAAELLRQFRHSPQPADRTVRRFVRMRKFLGAGDRRFVTDTFYHALRHMLRIDDSIRVALEDAPWREWLLRSTGFPISEPPNDLVWGRPKPIPQSVPEYDQWFDSLRIALAAEDMQPGFMSADLVGTFQRDWKVNDRWLTIERLPKMIGRCVDMMRLHAQEPKVVRWHVRHSLPEWMLAHVGFGLPPAEVGPLLESLNKPAPVALRVNTLKTTRDAYLKSLAEKGLEFKASAIAADGIVGSERVREGDLPGAAEGFVEFQDEGSQLVTEIADPRPGIRAIDACAGAGGKSLHFAAKMHNQGELLLHDSVPGRLKNAMKRSDEAGVRIAKMLFADFAERDPQAGELADIVLVDAPCTGSGTFRRSPELKWRVMRDTLTERIRVQAQLLEAWSRWVKPGGRLVYATCSLFNAENGEQIDAFLARHKEFRRAPLADAPCVRKDMLTRAGDVQLLPHRHGTDGFFVAVLQR